MQETSAVVVNTHMHRTAVASSMSLLTTQDHYHHYDVDNLVGVDVAESSGSGPNWHFVTAAAMLAALAAAATVAAASHRAHILGYIL